MKKDMTFKEFMKYFTEHSKSLFDDSDNLFVVNVDKDKLWETYIEAFPAEKNKIYRVNREYECSCCKSFIRHFSNVVSIQNNKIVTLWDFSTDDDTFEPVLRAMEKLIKNASVEDGFVTKDSKYGAEITREILENQTVHSWNHFYVDVPKKFIEQSSASVPEVKSTKRDIRNVFKRSLEELSGDSVQTVIDMIDEGQLYRGEEWKTVLQKFQLIQNNYNKLKTKKEKDNFAWIESSKAGVAVTKIKNHSIGTLLSDITDGVDVEQAVRKYETIVAPQNYKRPKPIYTKKMIEDAQKTIISLGLENSLGRRYAKVSDITVNNVLWVNRNVKKAISKGLDIFDEMKEDSEVVSPKKFEKLQGIAMSSFLEDIKNAKSVEVLFEGRHSSNLMSLLTGEEKDTPSLFKWNNSFSWAYNGNVSDSMLKENVKNAGGNVGGVLRFSLQWNDVDYNPNDYDAHCIEPNGNHIQFPNKTYVHPSSGVLDVDIVAPINGKPAVENISYSDFNRMPNGTYKFFVNNYSHNGGRSGFISEIEFDGNIYEFEYRKDLKPKENIVVAEVIKSSNGFKIVEKLNSSISQKTIWNIKTNRFTPVSTILLSPNYWDGNSIGNKHYFLMLSGCVNNTDPNGFYNEYLKEDFTKHRKVFEALGSKMKVKHEEPQLSGVGFSSTKRDYFIAKVDGKVLKVII